MSLVAYICSTVALRFLADRVWDPKTREALQRQPLGVLFYLLPYCSEADMQIRCNERSLCGGGGEETEGIYSHKNLTGERKGEGGGGMQTGLHDNEAGEFKGLEEAYVRSCERSRMFSGSIEKFVG